MIEGLTPQLTQVALFLVALAAPVLTLPLAAYLLRRYRRALAKSMAISGGFPPQWESGGMAQSKRQPATHSDQRSEAENLLGQLVRAPRRSAARYAFAGLAFAAAFSLPAQGVYPMGLGLSGFLVGVWVYLWPVVLALLWVIPGTLRQSLLYLLIYFLGFTLVGWWAATISNEPAVNIGALLIPARSTVTPETLLRLWFLVNIVPTLLVLLCFNRRVRAVAPLLLAWVTTALAGTLVAILTLFTEQGSDLAVELSVNLNLHVLWLVGFTALISLLLFTLLGWLLARWIANAYHRRKLSDQSLNLDAMWLLFSSTNCMWLVRGGLEWIVMLPLAFFVYRLVLRFGYLLFPVTKGANKGLVFLRVFALGKRSESLLQSVAGHWRYIGSIQMITGPDVAGTTVQPHEFLDYLSGRLASHFVGDEKSLRRRLENQEREADSDGRYRVNSFFCHADSWQPALTQLAGSGDSVLMDLRSFSPQHAGCVHELQFLVRELAFNRWLLITDNETDEKFMQQTLRKALQGLTAEAPNFGESPGNVRIYRFDSGSWQLQGVLRALAATTDV